MKFQKIFEADDAFMDWKRGIEAEANTDWDEWDRLDKRDAKYKQRDNAIKSHNSHFNKKLEPHTNIDWSKVSNIQPDNADWHVEELERAKELKRPVNPNRVRGPVHGKYNQTYVFDVANNDDAINAANAHIEEFKQQLQSKYNAEVVDIKRNNLRSQRAGTDFSEWTVYVNSPVVKTKIDQEWQKNVAAAKERYKAKTIEQTKQDKKTQRTRLNTLKSYLKLSPNVLSRFRQVKAEIGNDAGVVENGHQESLNIEIPIENSGKTTSEKLITRLYVVDASLEEDTPHIKYRIAFGPKPKTDQIKKGNLPEFSQSKIIDIASDTDRETYSHDELEVFSSGKAYVEYVDGEWVADIPVTVGQRGKQLTLNGYGSTPFEAIEAAFSEDDSGELKVSEKSYDNEP